MADIEVHEFNRLGSEYMDSAVLWEVANVVQFHSSRAGVDGVVITHGSDTVEESALFLDLLYKGQRPVVFVLAMRPATALSADGPFNLLQAVAIAANSASQSRGVMVTWSNRIASAAFVTKASSRAVDAF